MTTHHSGGRTPVSWFLGALWGMVVVVVWVGGQAEGELEKGAHTGRAPVTQVDR